MGRRRRIPASAGRARRPRGPAAYADGVLLRRSLCLPGVLLLALRAAADPPPPAPAAPPPTVQDTPHDPTFGLAAAPAWSARAMAATRLESSGHPRAGAMLEALSRDADARVRAFAVAAMVRRGTPPLPSSILRDPDRRVLRAALMAGGTPDPLAVDAAVEALLEAQDPATILMGAEMAAWLPEGAVRRTAQEQLGRAIMRLDRADAGALGSRLAVLLGTRPGYREGDWQEWWRRSPRERTLRAEPLPAVRALSEMDNAAFARLAAALRSAGGRPMDVAFCVDSTSSMWAEMGMAQEALDGLGRGVGYLAPGSRVAVVSYRDRRSEYETRVSQFTEDAASWRRALWQLVAERGGSAPESVSAGLEATYRSLQWLPERRGAVILVGDGPPHSGTGTACREMAAKARAAGVRTFSVCTRREGEREVKFFPEIAADGGGRMVRLEGCAALAPDVVGAELADDFAAPLLEFIARCERLARQARRSSGPPRGPGPASTRRPASPARPRGWRR